MDDVSTTSGPKGGWAGLELWKKILIAMIAGIVVGIVLGPKAEYLKPIGTLFISAIKMLIVPLIFSSLIVGVTSMSDSHKMGRIGLKSIVLYLVTTALAISIGLLFGTIFEPGAGVGMVASGDVPVAKEATSLVNTLLAIVPTNPVASLAKGSILQIIFFALALGISLNMIGEKAKPVLDVINSFAEAMYKLTELVMNFAPYGIFALIAWVAGKYGLDILLPLFKVIAVVYLGCIVHVAVVYAGGLKLIAGLSPVRYLRGILNAQMVAFTSTSSSGTLPVSIRCARENLGVSKGISSFVLPLGATINMDGTALYQGVTALFVAQAFGIDLTTADYLTIITTATLASIGTAGVPGAGFIMLSLVLAAVGLPMEGLVIIAGVERVLDMARTCVNVSGDLMVTTLIAKSEGELDEKVYNGEINHTESEIVTA